VEPSLSAKNLLPKDDRTWLAYERTLLAWVRTAISLITFGFAIHKFGQFLQEEQLLLGEHPRPTFGGALTPRPVAMMMIITGLATLLFSGVEHRRNLQRLGRYDERFSFASVLTLMIGVLGTVALLSVTLRQ
jgi:putative membrane protein